MGSTPRMEPTPLEASSVTLAYDHVVVRDLSMTVPDGRITAIVGPNASGKSTLLKAMARLLWPDRKSTRLYSSHANISYAVFCLKKKFDWRLYGNKRINYRMNE